MMGNICSSKTKLATQYLPNEYVKKTLSDKLAVLNSEQAHVITMMQNELNDHESVLIQRADEILHKKELLLDAIIDGTSTESLINCLDPKKIKLARLKELQTRLVGIKASSSTIIQMLNELENPTAEAEVKTEDQSIVENVVELINNPNGIVMNLDNAASTAVGMDADAVGIAVDIGLQAMAHPAATIIDSLMNEIRIKLQDALSEALKKSN